MSASASPPKKLAAINLAILQMMREMDSEALPVDGDYPTGLWWYVGHLDRDGTARKVNNSEVAWSRRLTEMFNHRGWSAVAEQRYPGASRDRCDCVVDLGFERPWWIEVKGSWREVFDRTAPNTAFAKHLHATAHDVAKLSSLGATHASGVSLVLVGFDRVDLPICKDDLKVACAGMTRCWKGNSSTWDVNARLRFRTHVWVWSRRFASTRR